MICDTTSAPVRRFLPDLASHSRRALTRRAFLCPVLVHRLRSSHANRLPPAPDQIVETRSLALRHNGRAQVLAMQCRAAVMVIDWLRRSPTRPRAGIELARLQDGPSLIFLSVEQIPVAPRFHGLSIPASPSEPCRTSRPEIMPLCSRAQARRQCCLDARCGCQGSVHRCWWAQTARRQDSRSPNLAVPHAG